MEIYKWIILIMFLLAVFAILTNLIMENYPKTSTMRSGEAVVHLVIYALLAYFTYIYLF
jgi:hypothetical protein